MNDQPIIPEAMSTPNSTENNPVAPVVTVAAAEPSSFWRSQQAPYALSAVLAVLLAMHWYASNTQIHSLRDEMARRLQLSDVSAIEVKGIAKTVQETSKDLQTKVTLLEGKQAEAQGQQLALEQLYQDLSKNRDEWALAEIEQVLATASQQLQLAGNVQGALIALQNADNRLAKSEKAQFIAVRRAIAKDIEMLKTLPQLDMTGLVLRLDSVIAQVDSIPLWSDEKPPATVTAPKAPLRVLPKPNKGKTDKENEASGENTFSTKVQDYWQSFSSEMWTEVKQLVRVRNVENPEALLLSPSQAYFARENLKLRLLNARLALLSRNEGAFRSDMISAQDIITKYFDVRSKQAQTAQSLLKQVQSNNLSIEMPALTESLNSVRNFKVKP
ncbi:uroporphyrinogen-III C-methyltransferase [Undibacterium sp. LX40W]|uniref:Uroporphyrinogen-III C-methyltransferase n=1 Tax=Undibacterium nitidum TaxID=2762298 RepID=A0A923HPA4_9BURK|nr:MULTISPECIES: uroporphyrinogen-III C-methyltransferase [Undibacterium]MBC3883054.1 uroporphyrinogen-III C-methyltransferase [Undibacterium nitidum]MBC3893335.1 uroporphyrinogen-III C-methyltransferase [Undibacterium sp. LX40W]